MAQHILSSLIHDSITSGQPVTRVRLPWRQDGDKPRQEVRRYTRTRDDEVLSRLTTENLKEKDDA